MGFSRPSVTVEIAEKRLQTVEAGPPTRREGDPDIPSVLLKQANG